MSSGKNARGKGKTQRGKPAAANRPAPCASPLAAGEEILYGIHTVREVLRNPARRILRGFATLNALKRLEPEFRAAGITPEVVRPREISRRLGPEAVHQGVLLFAEPLPAPALPDAAASGGILLLLDQITDPHNVGAILRTAAAFSIAAVITTARHAPATASGVLAKAASGALEHVPLVRITNLARAMQELRRDFGYTLWGLDSDGESTLDCRTQVPARIALVLGAEGKGLRLKTRETCDAILRLDMPGAIRSLNVSNACAIALFALHQGRQAGNQQTGNEGEEQTP